MAVGAKQNLVIPQGSIQQLQIQWVGSNNLAVDVSDYYAEMHIREDVDDTNTVLELSEVEGTIYNQGTSGFGISILASVSEALDFDYGVYDLEITPVTYTTIQPSQKYLGLGFEARAESYDSTSWMWIWPVGRITDIDESNWSDVPTDVFERYFELDPDDDGSFSAEYTLAEGFAMEGAVGQQAFKITNSDSGNDGYYLASCLTRRGIVAARCPGSESGFDSGSGTNDLILTKYDDADPANSQAMGSGKSIRVNNDDGGATTIDCTGWNPATTLSLTGGEVLRVTSRVTDHNFVGEVASADATSITFTDILHVADDITDDDQATIAELSPKATDLAIFDGFNYLDIDVDAKTLTAVSAGASTHDPFRNCQAGYYIRLEGSEHGNDGTYEIDTVVDDVITVTRTIEGTDSVNALGDPLVAMHLLTLNTNGAQKLLSGTVRLDKEVTR